MEERQYMPEISEEEFVANVERDDFLRIYGNPVRIREKNGRSLVCMAIEHYERMTRKLEDYRMDASIRYWVLEFEMPPEVKANFEKIARDNEMTPDEFFEASLLSALEHPAETAAAIRKAYEQNPDEDFGIRLIRKYPVYKGETEAQAHKRALAEEAADKAKKAALDEPTKAAEAQESPAGAQNAEAAPKAKATIMDAPESVQKDASKDESQKESGAPTSGEDGEHENHADNG